MSELGGYVYAIGAEGEGASLDQLARKESDDSDREEGA